MKRILCATTIFCLSSLLSGCPLNTDCRDQPLTWGVVIICWGDTPLNSPN